MMKNVMMKNVMMKNVMMKNVMMKNVLCTRMLQFSRRSQRFTRKRRSSKSFSKLQVNTRMRNEICSTQSPSFRVSGFQK